MKTDIAAVARNTRVRREMVTVQLTSIESEILGRMYKRLRYVLLESGINPESVHDQSGIKAEFVNHFDADAVLKPAKYWFDFVGFRIRPKGHHLPIG